MPIMIRFVLTWVEALMRSARDQYGVDPIVFLVIYLFAAPVFYYSLFRTARAMARRIGNEVALWSGVFLCAVVAPFLYVLFFGRNLPWWVYGAIGLLIAQGVLSVAMKLRRKHTSSAKG